MSERPARYNAGSEDSLEDEDTIVYVTAGAWCYRGGLSPYNEVVQT